jgi:hypothetical protein
LGVKGRGVGADGERWEGAQGGDAGSDSLLGFGDPVTGGDSGEEIGGGEGGGSQEGVGDGGAGGGFGVTAGFGMVGEAGGGYCLGEGLGVCGIVESGGEGAGDALGI